MSNKVSYVKNEEPAFIKAFKQKTGYKEGPTIDEKANIYFSLFNTFLYLFFQHKLLTNT